MRTRSGKFLGGILYTAAVAFALLLASPASQAFVNVGVQINIAPPELPVYEQPPIPGPGYLWTPGYWAWGDEDYYWVPGTWVEAPQPGYLWTPGYWGWNDGFYIWNGGYWGPHVGFYGGVNYGFGYTGYGYAGGYWDRGSFRYNRAYNNMRGNVHITNVYNRTVINRGPSNRVSYSGGNGIHARPRANEMAAERDHHLTPVPAQQHQEEGARGNPELRSSSNHGRPPIAATPRAGEFAGQGVMPARGAGAPHPTNFAGAPAHAAPAAPAAPAMAPRSAPETSPYPPGAPGTAGFAHNGSPLRGTASAAPAAPPHVAPNPMPAAPPQPTPGAMRSAGPQGGAPHAPALAPRAPPAAAMPAHNAPPAAQMQRGPAAGGAGPSARSGGGGGGAPREHAQGGQREGGQRDQGDRR
jgi:WXXGXW repeat (2 copies)